jgi:HK97 family phage major capsid protein
MDYLQLTARKSKINERLDELQALTEGEKKRALKADENAEFLRLTKELEGVEQKLADHEAAKRAMQERVKKQGAKGGNKTPEQRLAESYSISRAVKSHHRGTLEKDGGAELEAHQEGIRIARQCDLPIAGRGIMIPDFISRADSSTALAAGNLIPTNQMPVLDGYKPNLVLEQMGASMHTGLVGINNFPVSDLQADAGFVGESANSNTKEPSIRRPNATAKAVRAKTLATWLLKAQAGPDTDRLLTQNLLRAESNALNRVGIAGGGSNEPTGILSDSDVTTVAIGTNGGAIDYDKIVELMIAPENEDAGMFANYGFVMTPGVKGVLMKSAISDGDSVRIMNPLAQNQLLGYKAAATTLAPSNGSKGSGTNLHSILFGAFSEMHVCNWAVRELVLDPASDDTGLWVKLISFWDIVLANPKAFAKIIDVNISA